VVDLGHRGSEAALKLRLHGKQLLALALQGAVLGEVQLGGEDPDVARARSQQPELYEAEVGAGAGVSRSVRSISRVS
jgi:hypothetical protein